MVKALAWFWGGERSGDLSILYLPECLTALRYSQTRPLNAKQYAVAFTAIVTHKTMVELPRSHPLRRPRIIPGMSWYSPA